MESISLVDGSRVKNELQFMSVAFKEWALVCEALGNGNQSLILRKGGIAEGREGFAFKHSDFFLFPTWFHEQLGRTTLPPESDIPTQLDGKIEIRYAATLEWSRLVTDPALLPSLREFHILHDDVVNERFRYDDHQGIHVGFVRVLRLNVPQRLADSKSYGGCRSWLDLPAMDDIARVPVISDEEHQLRQKKLEQILS
jgi:hypothetical protein